MADVNLTYGRSNGMRLLNARAMVSKGWQEWKNGYGFFGKGFIEHPGDLTISVDLRVMARFPARLSQRASEFPQNLTLRGDFDFGFFLIKGGKVAAILYLDGCLSATEGKTKRHLRSNLRIAESDGITYDLEVAFTVIGPRGKPLKPSWQGSEPGVYASGFERNRRKH